MQQWRKALRFGALALMLFCGTMPVYAQSSASEPSTLDELIDDATPRRESEPLSGEIEERTPEEGWNWAGIERLAVATDAGQYKTLRASGTDSLIYVPMNDEGRLFFSREGLAEQIRAQLQHVISDTKTVIPLTVASAPAVDDAEGYVAQLSFAPTADLGDLSEGLYYVNAQLPEHASFDTYGYAVVNPEVATAVDQVQLRIYASEVSAEAAPVYTSSAAMSVDATAHASYTPSSGELVLYPTPIDALLVAKEQDASLTNVQLRPFQSHVLRPLVTGVQIGTRDYQVSEADDDVTWRFAVYDAQGQKKTQLYPEFADLYHLESGDTVVWALTGAAFPNVLPTIPSDEPNTTDDLSRDHGEPESSEPVAWGVDRLSAANRQELAVQVSQTYFPEATRAIIVNDFAFADGLSATNLTQGEAPILYTKADQIFQVTIDELKRLSPQEVFVMGGTASVGENVMKAIRKAVPKAKVVRIDGRDRFEVNIHSLTYVEAFPAVVVTNGMDFADALTATPLAQAKGGVVLLTKPEAPAVLKDFLSRLTGTALYVVGGEKSVSPAQVQEFEVLARQKATRLSGRDRYAVSGDIATTTFVSARQAIVASGELYSDALVAAPLSQKWKAPILLTRKGGMPLSALEFFQQETALEHVTVMGGPATVSDDVLKTLRDAATSKAQ